MLCSVVRLARGSAHHVGELLSENLMRGCYHQLNILLDGKAGRRVISFSRRTAQAGALWKGRGHCLDDTKAGQLGVLVIIWANCSVGCDHYVGDRQAG